MIRKQLMVVLILFLWFFTTQLWGSPQLVQMSDDVDWNPVYMSYSATESSGQYRTINLPEKTIQGNMLTAFIEIDSTGNPPTVTLRSNDTTTATIVQTFTRI